MSARGVTRREFVQGMGMASVACALPVLAAPVAGTFSFLHITDTHLEPELDAVHGTAMAMRHARTFRADFAIQGGDHVFDALGVSKARAVELYDLYGKTEQDLGLKVHHVLGNHDVFGIYPPSGAGAADPEYGKKMFEGRFGPAFYSFDHKGVHFVVLDSIGITGEKYEARIDADQLAWLAGDLGGLLKGMPVIVTTHIPLVTAVNCYATVGPKTPPPVPFIGGPEAIRMLEGYNVLGVLQGHTHVNETVVWRGIPFMTSGAVCGNWWKGTRLGTPEGFTVATVAGGKLTTRYETYGFRSVAAENT